MLFLLMIIEIYDTVCAHQIIFSSFLFSAHAATHTEKSNTVGVLKIKNQKPKTKNQI